MKLETSEAAAPPAPPLPAEVEEIAKALREHALNIECDDGMPHLPRTTATMRAAASLLSRWPGVWRPIDQYKIDEEYFRKSGDRWGKWVIVELLHPKPMGDGVWRSYHIARLEADEWLARDPEDAIAMTPLGAQPARFYEFPEPPHE